MSLFAKNLLFLREKNKLSQAAMLTQLGIPRTTWISYEIGKSEPDIDRIIKISKYFGVGVSELTTLDLSKGNLNALKQVAKKLQKGNLNGNVKGNLNEQKRTSVTEPNEGFTALKMPKIVTVNTSGVDNILFVPIKAQAGYLIGYGDQEFMETLPSFQMPGLRNGTFRMFEVAGISMHPTLSNQDRVIGEFIQNIMELRENRIHIVVMKEGVKIKRVINRIKERGKIYLKSDTLAHRSDFPIEEIDPSDIIELWYVRMRVSSDLREPSEVFTRLTELELSIQEINKKLNLK